MMLMYDIIIRIGFLTIIIKLSINKLTYCFKIYSNNIIYIYFDRIYYFIIKFHVINFHKYYIINLDDTFLLLFSKKSIM